MKLEDAGQERVGPRRRIQKSPAAPLGTWLLPGSRPSPRPGPEETAGSREKPTAGVTG